MLLAQRASLDQVLKIVSPQDPLRKYEGESDPVKGNLPVDEWVKRAGHAALDTMPPHKQREAVALAGDRKLVEDYEGMSDADEAADFGALD